MKHPSLLSSWEMTGSNCWAVHGNHTESGKPILSCDPHLAKFTNPTWYLTRIAWNETTIEDGVRETYRTHITGYSILGAPYFTYLRTPFVAGGVTSLNQDSQDLFLEEVKDGKYLSSDGTWKDVQTIHEVIKVRFGSDVHFDVRYTDNGVLMT